MKLGMTIKHNIGVVIENNIRHCKDNGVNTILYKTVAGSVYRVLYTDIWVKCEFNNSADNIWN